MVGSRNPAASLLLAALSKERNSNFFAQLHLSRCLVCQSEGAEVREHPEHIKEKNQENDACLPGQKWLSRYVQLGFVSARGELQNYGNSSWLKQYCWGRGGNRGEVFYLQSFRAKPEHAGCF